MAPRFQLHGHLVSQPTRSVMWFCLLHKVDFEFIHVNLPKGEHLKSGFVNPNHQVPVLVDTNKNGEKFVLAESSAILVYLCEELNITGPWAMPTSPRQRARVFEYLSYHTGNTRANLSGKIFIHILTASRTKKDPSARVAAGVEAVKGFLRQMELRLQRGGGFVAGAQPSIADLLAFPEFAQLETSPSGLHVLDYAALAPEVHAWMLKLRALPFYEEVHKGSAKFAALMRQGKTV